jgi:hypothetical protein
MTAAWTSRLGSVTPSFLIVVSTGPGSALAVGSAGSDFAAGRADWMVSGVCEALVRMLTSCSVRIAVALLREQLKRIWLVAAERN